MPSSPARVNGDGSISRRGRGRWVGRFYALAGAGTRKRVTVYGKTRQQAADNMRSAQERNSQGIPVPDRSWKLSDWLDYWLENVVAANRRPATYDLYEATVRLYLKPSLGSASLTRLSATRVQVFLNSQLAAGQSVRRVQIMRTVLSSALTRAMREELVMRNVARLAELPGWERQPITPWSADEARAFLAAAADDPLYPAFLLLLLYGLRRGEVLGLRWVDVDQKNNEIHIRQQIHRGQWRAANRTPSRHPAGRRDLPLLTFASEALTIRLDVQAADHAELGRAWQDTGLIFTTRTGRPIEPRNLVRSFQPHLLSSRLAGDQGSPSAAHHRHAAQESGRTCPRCAAHPRSLADGRDAGDLHTRGSASQARRADEDQRRAPQRRESA